VLRATVAARAPAVIRLPALIRRVPVPLYLLVWAPYILAYQLTNRFHFVEPSVLPLTWADRAVPFVPALLPLYLSYIPYFWWTVARSESDREVNRVFYATHLQLLVSLPFFVLVPIRFPRELFYPPGAIGWADAFWRWFDAPTNCFPSLHVANVLVLAHLNRGRPYPGLHAGVAAGIVASTLLVKQHYVVDLVGGVAVYGIARWFLARLVIDGSRSELLRKRT
jgi:hypothetical protein